MRPVHLIEEDIPRLIVQLTEELEQEIGMFARPFGLMLEQVRQSYAPLSLSTKNADVSEKIYKQFLLLRWYVEKGFAGHAVLLAREWVVSALCVLTGCDDYLKREHRKAIEDQLNLLKTSQDNPELNQPIAAHVKDAKALADFWGCLGNYRNDTAHVQMNESLLNSESLERFVQKDSCPAWNPSSQRW